MYFDITPDSRYLVSGKWICMWFILWCSLYHSLCSFA
jgi:hypothetical protein